MQDLVQEAMPRFFELWCAKFDNLLGRDAQRKNFRQYLAGLLSKCEQKNVLSMATHTDDAAYRSLYNFLHDSLWNAEMLNNRRIQILNSCRQL